MFRQPTKSQESPANANTDFPTPSVTEQGLYIKRLQREVARILSKGYPRSPEDVKEIVSGVLERFSKDWRRFMAQYTAVQFARVTTRQVASSADRAERRQRAEGVRLIEISDETGTYRRKARSYESGSTPVLDGEAELLSMARSDGPSVEDQVIDAVDSDAEARLLLEVLSERERRVLLAVDRDRRQVIDVARAEKLERETLSRIVNGARRKVRHRAEELGLHEGDGDS